jgi:hypothetical protein
MTQLFSTPTNGDAPTANDDFDQSLRVAIARQLGESGFQDRSRYDAFGWEKDPDEEEYAALYLRNPFAAGIIDKPAQLAWRNAPTVTDSDDDTEDTAFTESVQKLARNHNAWTYATRVHRIAGVGEFALLFVDFDDVGDDMSALADEPDLSNPSLDDIRGFRVVPQFAVDEIDYGDFGSERWGEPEHYHVDWTEDLDDDTEDTTGGARIHHSRVVEVPSKPPTMGEFSSRPRMEPLLNPLYDIEKAMGSAAEVAYRGADKGLHINFDPSEVDPNAVTGDSGLKNNISEWYHGLQPTLNTVGGEVNDLGGEIPDPSPVLDSELTAISAATGFSKQFIEGAAAGEIASSETNLREDLGEVAERQEQYVTPYIVRRLIQTLVDAGILPTPRDGDYRVTWPDLFQMSAEETATVEQKRSQTAKNLGIMGDPAKEYVESGSFPEESAPAMPAVDESNPAVANQFDALSGNEDDPFGDIPVIPDGLTELTRPWLVRWAEWVAAGRPEVTPVRQRANDFNPALHPRDPDTGQFVERSFQVPDDAPDFGDMSAPETLQYLDDNGADVSGVLAPDSGVTIDGISSDIDAVEELKTDAEDNETLDTSGWENVEVDDVSEGDFVETKYGNVFEITERQDDGGDTKLTGEDEDGDEFVVARTDSVIDSELVKFPESGTPEGWGSGALQEFEQSEEIADALANDIGREVELSRFSPERAEEIASNLRDLGIEDMDDPPRVIADRNFDDVFDGGAGQARPRDGDTPPTILLNPKKADKDRAEMLEDGWRATGSMGEVATHEFAHIRDFQSETTQRQMEIWRGSKLEAEIKEQVSTYATSNKLEFIAEMYSGIYHGNIEVNELDDEVIELYKSLNGPPVPGKTLPKNEP